MDEEQIIVDIKVDSDDIKTADKRVDQLTDSIEELGNRIKTARKINNDFKKEQKELNEQYKQGKISTEQYEKGIDDINKKIKVNNKFIAENSIELGKQKSERTANIKLLNSEANSRDQLRQKIAILTREYNGLNIETKDGRLQSEKLKNELRVLNEQLNEGSKAAGSFKDNIGNYPEVVGGASLSLTQLGDGLEQVPGASSNAVGGVKMLGNAFKALLANPVVLVIAAIVAGLSALFSAFKRSESGSKLLSKAMAGLRGIMAVVTKLADTIGKAFSSSMDEAEESTVGFWEALKTNFVNRIQGLLDLMKSVGEGIAALFSGSADELEKAGEKAKNALIAIGTGMDEAQFEEAKQALSDLAKEAAAITQAFIDLETAQRSSRAGARFLEKDIAKLQASFDILSESAGNDTQSLLAQRDAAIEAGKVAAQLASQEEKLARTRLGIINMEVSTRRRAGENIQDILDDQAQAQVALTEATSKNAIAQQKILIEQRKIERDIFEQNLDILIDVGDKIKTEQEKAIQNESFSLEKRKMLLEASKAALKANFDEIKKEYELYGITAEEINEVISASDAKQANEKLKALGLNEIANNRLREIILERKQAELDFNDLQIELGEEELERKLEANEIIQEINDEFDIHRLENFEETTDKLIFNDEQLKEKLIGNTEKLRDKLIEIERRKLAVLLADETLFDEERKALNLTTEANIEQIEIEFALKKKEREMMDSEARKQAVLDEFNTIVALTTDFAGKEAAIFGNISSSIITAFEQGEISAVTALSAIGMASNALFDAATESRDKDLTENEAYRKAELELASGNKEAQDRINIEFDKKAAALKLKQFKADKKKALVEVAIATALGAAKALPNLILAGIVAAFGIAQGVIIGRKQPPKFAKGTNDIVNIGGSHASGNDVDVFGVSGNQKQYFGKVEKGEAMPVIRKSAVNDYMIAKMNGKFSPSNGRKFQDGTPDITSQQTEAANNQVFLNNLVTAFSNVKIVTKVEDITKGVAQKAEIVDNSKV